MVLRPIFLLPCIFFEHCNPFFLYQNSLGFLIKQTEEVIAKILRGGREKIIYPSLYSFVLACVY